METALFQKLYMWIDELTGCFIKGEGIVSGLCFVFLKLSETALNVLPYQLCLSAIQKDAYFATVQSHSVGWQLKN